MNIDLGLESLNTEESTVSFEELMVDILESEQQFSEEQSIFDSIDRLGFIRDYVSEHGVSDTISAMIGDQISYSSAEELVEKIDVAIEGLLSKVTGDTLQNTLNVCRKVADEVLYCVTRFNKQTNIDKNQKFKFFDLSSSNSLPDKLERAGQCLKMSIMQLSGTSKPTENVIDTNIDNLKELTKELNNAVRSFTITDLTYNEYKAELKHAEDIAKMYKTNISKLSWATLFKPNATVGEIVDKVIERTAKKEGAKSAYDKASRNYYLNNRFNVVARGLLRSVRIILTKFMTLMKQTIA